MKMVERGRFAWLFIVLAVLFLAGRVRADVARTTYTLSQARSSSAATSVGNKAFFAGGSSASGMSDGVDIYDAGTDTWSTAALSTARS